VTISHPVRYGGDLRRCMTLSEGLSSSPRSTATVRTTIWVLRAGPSRFVAKHTEKRETEFAMQVDPTSERAVWRNIDAANLYHDVHVVATTTNTTPWFQGTIGERLLQKWGYKHAFKAPKLPNTRYALVQHEFRGLKTDDERYTEAELHVDGCNIMFDWADKGITHHTQNSPP